MNNYLNRKSETAYYYHLRRKSKDNFKSTEDAMVSSRRCKADVLGKMLKKRRKRNGRKYRPLEVNKKVRRPRYRDLFKLVCKQKVLFSYFNIINDNYEYIM